jgi:hypothetical protein
MSTILKPEVIDWMTEGLKRADKIDVKTKVDSDGIYIRTPWKLCEEIISQIIQQSDITNKKILVVDTLEFIPVLLAFGVNKCNIAYIAPYEFKGKMASTLGVTVIQDTLLTWKTNMKFDVVIGNPPYKQGMWRKFLEKSLPLASEMEIFITPNATIETTVKCDKLTRILKDNGIQRVVPCHYPYFKDVITSSEISYHIFNKNVKFNHTLFHRILTESEKLTISIVAKIKQEKEKVGGLTQTMKNGQKQKGSSGIIDVITNVTQSGVTFVKGSRADNKIINQSENFVFVNKFFGMNPTDLIYTHFGEIGVSDNDVYYISREGLSAKDFERIYLSKLMRFILAYYRGTNSRTLGWSIRELPIVETCVLNLYAHFNLTQEEIDYIEATVK